IRAQRLREARVPLRVEERCSATARRSARSDHLQGTDGGQDRPLRDGVQEIWVIAASPAGRTGVCPIVGRAIPLLESQRSDRGVGVWLRLTPEEELRADRSEE